MHVFYNNDSQRFEVHCTAEELRRLTKHDLELIDELRRFGTAHENWSPEAELT